MTREPHMLRRCLAIAASLLILAACSGGDEGGTASSSASTAPTSTATDTGSMTIQASVIGGNDYPRFSVDVPSNDWLPADDHFVLKHGADALGLSVWDVGKVPLDPCHWRKQFRQPGPTVDDLVEALATQRLRNATEPKAVTLAGYEGRYLELSVPADMRVSGDADFEGCDVMANGHLDFISWLGNDFGERYEQVAGQVDMLWILDVDGQRLVIDATYSPNTTKAERAELASIVQSLRFEDPSA